MKKLILFLLLAALVGAFALYYIFFAPNVQREQLNFYIGEEESFDAVSDAMQRQDLLKSVLTFKIAAKVLSYDEHVCRGKYVLNEGESNYYLIAKLRKGQHYPVKFTFNNVRTPEQLMKKLSAYHFLFEWQSLYKLLHDEEFLKAYGLTPQTVMAIFIPNTYEFYYDITAETFFDKMYDYYQKFWNEQRRQRAEAIGLTPLEVVTLASIVEEENFADKEKAIIAGLYMNRLHLDMPLQADPTVRFALGDFTIKRVLNEHLAIDSPYNTYLYRGLPPGPIRIPAISTVDSVLHYAKHNYLYMCAKEDFSGEHNFTASYNQHLQNAARYRKALSQKLK